MSCPKDFSRPFGLLPFALLAAFERRWRATWGAAAAADTAKI
jgi:hypothetical protein